MQELNDHECCVVWVSCTAQSLVPCGSVCALACDARWQRRSRTGRSMLSKAWACGSRYGILLESMLRGLVPRERGRDVLSSRRMCNDFHDCTSRSAGLLQCYLVIITVLFDDKLTLRLSQVTAGAIPFVKGLLATVAFHMRRARFTQTPAMWTLRDWPAFLIDVCERTIYVMISMP